MMLIKICKLPYRSLYQGLLLWMNYNDFFKCATSYLVTQWIRYVMVYINTNTIQHSCCISWCIGAGILVLVYWYWYTDAGI